MLVFKAILALFFAGKVLGQKATKCSTTAVEPPPQRLHCGDQGKLSNPQVIGNTVGGTFNACRKTCLDNDDCVSFSYDQANLVCKTYPTTLEGQGFSKSQNGIVNYNRNCYHVQCTVSVTVKKTTTVLRTKTISNTDCFARATATFRKKSFCTATATASATCSTSCTPCADLSMTMMSMMSMGTMSACPPDRAAAGCGAGAGAFASCPVTVTVTSGETGSMSMSMSMTTGILPPGIQKVSKFAVPTGAARVRTGGTTTRGLGFMFARATDTQES